MRYATILFVLVSFITSAQSPVVGTWKIDWSAVRSAMSAAESEKFNKMSSVVQARAQKSFESREFRFGNDGKLTVSWESESPRTAEGTWQATVDRIKLTVDGQEKNYTYSIDNDRMTLRETPAGKGTFSVLVMNKIR
ncbi:hypothetical protein WSM22_40070 [Cytophagales bacterium WSM2-2]|nr:hypothetical protein WSM22_40070 [Cytophagales bacterium WSM2-2]